MILPSLSSRSRRRRGGAFTLIEILLASMGAALVLAALYGVFIHAIRLRDTATNRVRDARMRARAESVIRTDLQNAYISGGTIAASLQGGTDDGSGPGGSSLPGYLKFTTTTGRDTGADLFGDVQQVEYYLQKDPDAPTGAGGGGGGNILVRAITRDLLGATTTTAAAPAREEQILRGVQSLAVEFYDGSTWQEAWNYDSEAAALTNASSDSTGGVVVALGNTTLPDAIRIEVQQAAATPDGHLPKPVEILVPWTTQPFAAATPAAATASSNGSGNNVNNTPTPPPAPTPPENSRPGPDGGEPPHGPPPNEPPTGPPPDEPPAGGGRPHR